MISRQSLLFSLTLFVSSALLFSVQPMVARLTLPLLGGSPAVWATCMLFFQAALLLAYLYSHLASRHIPSRIQIPLHCAAFASIFLLLPIHIPGGWDPSRSTSPATALLELLLVMVAPPFVLIATTSPLLQRWFKGRDPYFLYVASNLGSMTALLAYPVLIERVATLKRQLEIWRWGYLLASLLILCCAVVTWKQSSADESVHKTSDAPPIEIISVRRKLAWLALAFLPSSLMVGLTRYLTTDLAAIPLLWIIPLALYLLTFILAFANLPPFVNRLSILSATPLVIAALALKSRVIQVGFEGQLVVHCAAYFVIALICHTELSKKRPSPAHLTEFYLWLALGGMLGGLFNALLAPMIFTSIIEYPLVLCLALLVLPASGGSTGLSKTSKQVPAWKSSLGYLIPAATLLYVFATSSNTIRLIADPIRLVSLGIAFLAGALLTRKPRLLRVGMSMVLLFIVWQTDHSRRTILQARSFYSTLSLRHNDDNTLYELYNGTTLHGRQWTDPSRRGEPLSYYHREGPIGQVFAMLEHSKQNSSYAVIGLGTGTLAAFASKGQSVTFYEIDPLVERIALDPRYFTFLSDAKVRGARVEIIEGDARIRIRDASPGSYGLIIVDAFSSDAIPLHLITREALSLYLSKLTPQGILAFHISNRYLDLGPVLARLGSDLGLTGLSNEDDLSSEEKGKAASDWVVLSRSSEALAQLIEDERWGALVPVSGSVPWTDDFSDLLSVLGRSKRRLLSTADLGAPSAPFEVPHAASEFRLLRSD